LGDTQGKFWDEAWDEISYDFRDNVVDDVCDVGDYVATSGTTSGSMHGSMSEMSNSEDLCVDVSDENECEVWFDIWDHVLHRQLP
jgi:hypothetical protein